MRIPGIVEEFLEEIGLPARWYEGAIILSGFYYGVICRAIFTVCSGSSGLFQHRAACRLGGRRR
jgi:hypothetical protein